MTKHEYRELRGFLEAQFGAILAETPASTPRPAGLDQCVGRREEGATEVESDGMGRNPSASCLPISEDARHQLHHESTSVRSLEHQELARTITETFARISHNLDRMHDEMMSRFDDLRELIEHRRDLCRRIERLEQERGINVSPRRWSTAHRRSLPRTPHKETR